MVHLLAQYAEVDLRFGNLIDFVRDNWSVLLCSEH